MATSIGQYTPVFLPGEPPDREAWQATAHRVTKSCTWPKQPCVHRGKSFLPVAALPQWGLVWRWHSWLVCRDPGSAKCAGTQIASLQSYGTIRVFFWASCSWQSEDLFGQSFSVALPIQALRGLPCPGSFSVVWCIRDIEGDPHTGVLLCSLVHQAFDGPASLLFSCKCWHVGRERLW